MADRRFFSSLKQAEDRLASEPKERKDPSENILHEESTPTSSSPLFLACNSNHQHVPGSLTNEESDDGPPMEFMLSNTTTTTTDLSVEEDLDRLIGLLGLSKDEDDHDGDGDVNECCSCSRCSNDGFYRRVLGVEVCQKQLQGRLDRWIRYYYGGGEDKENKGKKEPLRLAHLLLAKAVSSGSTGCLDFGELEICPVLDEYFRFYPKSIN